MSATEFFAGHDESPGIRGVVELIVFDIRTITSVDLQDTSTKWSTSQVHGVLDSRAL